MKFKRNDPSADLTESLKQLIIFLYNCFEKEVIVLIDEYDAPLSNMFWSEHYQNIKTLHDSILRTLKGNFRLKKQILIGCFPVPIDDGSSWINNFQEMTIENEYFGKYFGFTQTDVDELLEKICKQADITGQEMKDIKDAVKNWYNGYLIIKTTIYNPYSIMNFIGKYMRSLNLKQSLKCYWAKNSAIDIDKRMLQ